MVNSVNEDKRKQRSYRFKEETLNKIKAVADQRHCYHTDAIEFMIDQYFVNQANQYEVLMTLFERLLDKKLDEKLMPIKEDTSRTRIASNIIDKTTQMQLEFWNHYFITNDFKAFVPTEKYKAEELLEAEKVVQNRISHNRQKKLDWESKRQNKKTDHVEEN